MLQKEDANTIANTKKELYIKTRVLELIPRFYTSIRNAANNKKFAIETQMSEEYFEELVAEICPILESSGYKINVVDTTKEGSSKVIFKTIQISWE